MRKERHFPCLLCLDLSSMPTPDSTSSCLMASIKAHSYPSQSQPKGPALPRQSPYPMYCSDLLNFLARYLADALLGIFTMDSSLP